MTAAVLGLSSAAFAQSIPVPLNYNFNGIVHANEAGNADDPNGFRSISDRALDFSNSRSAGNPWSPHPSGVPADASAKLKHGFDHGMVLSLSIWADDSVHKWLDKDTCSAWYAKHGARCPSAAAAGRVEGRPHLAGRR